MNIANHKRIEVAASPPSAIFRLRLTSKASEAALDTALAYARHRSVPIAVFILTAALVAFATNLSMHLLNLRMHDLGISEFDIGLSVAAQAFGIIIVAPLTKHAIAQFGIRKTFVIGALVASGALIAFAYPSNFSALAALRLIFAMGLALLFTVSESLVITRADSSNRGKVVGWYATSLAVGTAGGPAFLTLSGVEGLSPLLWGALLFWLSLVPVLAYVQKGHELAPVARNSTFAAIRLVPIAFLTAFVFGVADNGGMSMLSIYSALNGYDYSQAAVFVTIAMIGGVVLQIPLGYASNNGEPRTALLRCGVSAIILLTILPNIMGFYNAALGVSFALGGVLEGLYTIGLICIAKYCRTVGISSANGCFVSMCSLGEFVGPLTTGTSIHYLGSHGFVVGLTILLALYIVLLTGMKSNVQSKALAAH